MKTFPWLKLFKKAGPDLSLEPPVWLGDISNGEYFHTQTPRQRRMRKMILERADEGARRLGVDRRQFLASSSGMAVTLGVFNLFGCSASDDGPTMNPMNGGAGPVGSGGMLPAGSGGASGGGGQTPMGSGNTPGSGGTTPNGSGGGRPEGGHYDAGKDPLDAGEHCAIALDPAKEFVFDIQSHAFSDRVATGPYASFISILPQARCGKGSVQECFQRNEYVRQMFLNSDTTVSVLSGIPAVDGSNPLTNAEIAEARDIINAMAHSQRVVSHCMVLPNYQQAQSFERMQSIKEEFGVGAWKCYTPWGPDGTGWYLDDEAVGIPFIRRGLDLGVKTFCCHKGLPLPTFDTVHTNPRDVGIVAKMFPEAKFIIYHSAFQFGGNAPEGPYVENGTTGVNSLITSMIKAGIGPNQNVYGELGSTWYFVMQSPNQAAHVIGKLLKYVGENNVVWGTDSIWYGSPQPQIEAFLRFNISEQFQQQYGYPALTPEIKRKILGLNAARAYGIDASAVRCGIDKTAVALFKRELDDEFGPRRWATDVPPITTRRQFLDVFRLHRGLPG
jgi:predicted TIM-barrel fold metal-dependent hydrolase